MNAFVSDLGNENRSINQRIDVAWFDFRGAVGSGLKVGEDEEVHAYFSVFVVLGGDRIVWVECRIQIETKVESRGMATAYTHESSENKRL